MANLLVINPNSNESVTRGIDDSMQSYREAGIAIYVSTLEKAPFGIESEEDAKAVVPLVVTEITGNPSFDAYIIACYSDPGLNEARTVCKDKPVLGIQESAVSLAASQGKSFGVLALSRDSIQRHIAYVRHLGYQAFHAGERPLDISVDQGVTDPAVLPKMIEAGRELVVQDGAEVVILGCAGLSKHRTALSEALGVEVLDPVHCGVELACEAVGM